VRTSIKAMVAQNHGTWRIDESIVRRRVGGRGEGWKEEGKEEARVGEGGEGCRKLEFHSAQRGTNLADDHGVNTQVMDRTAFVL
jgi:hypothetical protein